MPKNSDYFRPNPLDKREYFNSDLDFTTNAPSYYEALSKFTNTLRILTERLNDVEGRVIDLFLEWLRDGVIEEIINVNIFTKLNERLNKVIDDLDNHIKIDFTNLLNEFNILLDDFETFVITTGENFEQVQKDIKFLRNELNKEIKKLNDRVPKNHYVSTAFKDLQQAIYSAEGGTLYIKAGTYLITKPLKIRSNTKIIAYGCTFKRNANINNLFINDSDGKTGGFSANRNIEIYGGTIDGAGGSFQDNCTLIAFGHAHDIKIIDMTFKNLRNWHMIELNAVRNGLIEGCTFSDYGSANKGSEMVQIDLARGSAQFPWFGPYDNTTCETIIIRNNKFTDGVRGIGTHSSTDGYEHHRIYILHNEFYNMSGEAVYGLDWAFTKIHGNHFRNIQKAVHLRVKGHRVHNHSIVDNYMSGKNNGDSRAIQITGINEGYSLDGGNISNNKIKRFGGHGVGVDYCEKWVIEGNDITSCGKSGIIYYRSIYGTINNNISRGNNTSNGNNNDIGVASPSTKVAISNNVIDTFTSTSGNREVLATGNIVHNSLSMAGTNSHAINNIVGGVLK